MTDSDLRYHARQIRGETLRIIHRSTGGHPGGALSIADVLAVLYFSEMRIDPHQPRWSDRDRLVLSKGHGCASLYAALGLRGFFDCAEFDRFRRLDGLLQGHPSVSIPGIDAPSGSLGMGLSQGLGMALGGRCTGRNFRTWVILGDGDMQEGCTWEAIMATGHHRVASLCAILDANTLQADGRVCDTMDYAPVREKIEAFRWNVIETDGHDCDFLASAFHAARDCRDKPTLIVARTVKGKGVSFMEDQPHWHGTVKISDSDLERALAEIGTL
ncbi:MAG: transketolase [Deltaproteobacteria bacterium]|nr:transketolase [Deltaproteobacteria bacterium]